jgi:YesN/AraC family two-component response regulator
MDRVNSQVHTLLFAHNGSVHDLEFVAVLRGKKAGVIEATSGLEVIGLCSEHPEIELIMVNIDIPVLNGIDTILEIRKTNNIVPTILLSEFLTVDAVKVAYGIGCNEILQKPVKQFAIDAIFEKYLHD